MANFGRHRIQLAQLERDSLVIVGNALCTHLNHFASSVLEIELPQALELLAKKKEKSKGGAVLREAGKDLG